MRSYAAALYGRKGSARTLRNYLEMRGRGVEKRIPVGLACGPGT